MPHRRPLAPLVQQMQMLLFSSFTLLSSTRTTPTPSAAEKICHKRLADLYKGLGIKLKKDPLCAAYYRELDLEVWARQMVGDDFMDYVEAK